jgi:hypothetical protein
MMYFVLWVCNCTIVINWSPYEWSLKFTTFAHIEPYELYHWHPYLMHVHNILFCSTKLNVHTIEQQTSKVWLFSIFMWIITLPNKIKLRTLMLHLDGWAQQPTYWWHTINPLFFGTQNICRWGDKNNGTTNIITLIIYF